MGKSILEKGQPPKSEIKHYRYRVNEIFWMGGQLASGVIQSRSDLTQLDDGTFWALSISYEGEIVATSFAQVENAPFPTKTWQALEGRWQNTHPYEKYCSYVSDIREAIAHGDVYQVNACRILSTACPWQLDGLFSQILARNPAPYAAYLRTNTIEIASASPELFLKRDGDFIVTSPIKGTRAPDGPGFGSKDGSENIMIVDLMRNDLSAVCSEVTTPHLLREEEHPGLNHLVSDVAGKLKPGLPWHEIVQPLLPAGSISGAPKSSARRIIAEHEGARGPYCGVLGWVHGDQALLSVAIRIFWRDAGDIKFGTGAGITWSSDPEQEWLETELKASRLISIAGGST